MSREFRRWIWLLLALPLLAGLARVRLETEVLQLLPSEVPVVRGLQLYQQHFTNSRELLVTFHASDPDAAETAARRMAEALRARSDLVAEAHWQPPWLEQPDRMAGLIAHLWLNQPPVAFAELTARLAPRRLEAVALDARDRLATSMSPSDLARLGYDPFEFARLPDAGASASMFDSPLEGFASADGTFRAVYVVSAWTLPNYRSCAAWIGEVRAVARALVLAPDWPSGLEPRFTGSPAFIAEMATGMARDMQLTVLVTLALIVALFAWAHRSWRPLALLVAMLALVLVGALAAGGWIFGTLNAVSLGFGAILLGLAVDCGLVVYQEAAAAPHRTASELRRELAASVGWSAATTASAFFLLNLAGLPGLSQLGTLVGIGVLLAPVVMMYLFLPLSLRWLRRRPCPAPRVAPPRRAPHPRVPRAITVGLVLLAALAVARHPPRVDRGSAAIEPGHGAAQVALREFRENLNRLGEPLLLVVEGRDDREVAERLDQVERHLASLPGRGVDFQVLLPGAVWPRPDRQRTNAAPAMALAERLPEFIAAAAQAGFAPEATTLTTGILHAFGRSADTADAWPTNAACRWLLRRAAARTSSGSFAAGAVYPGPAAASPVELARRLDPRAPGVWVTGWPLLGDALVRHVGQRVRWLVLAIGLVVTLCLWLAFRRWVEVVLSLGALAFMLLAVQAVMGMCGLSWNLMSLAALPLLLGVGVDYIIHVQVALRRHGGDLAAMRRVTGRAILLCAATNVEGFGSNILSGNPGLASLGTVCAIGIVAAYVTALHLVPAWWMLAGPPPDLASLRIARPSSAYGPRLWRLGTFLAPWLPRPALRGLAGLAAWTYGTLHPRRRRVVEDNLLPVLNGDRAEARRIARALFLRFGAKIGDLLRHEGGSTREIPLVGWHGYDLLRAALDRGQGVLLVTPHLGNWEFGGCLLARKGVRLLVLTQDEPGEGFTDMRRRARERWGIETLVVGRDAFGFVEIIRRLQEGSTVALLIDRPPPNSGVEVEFMGHPFLASIAPAELARASGCAIVPVYVVAQGAGYSAQVLAEIPYDRRALGQREARRRFAGEILRAFEPVIRQHPDQWFHFVPLWDSRRNPPPQ